MYFAEKHVQTSPTFASKKYQDVSFTNSKTLLAPENLDRNLVDKKNH